MHIIVITLFPEMIEQACGHGVLGRAVQNGVLKLDCINPRDFTHDRHRTVDDRPYGGGPGMLMKYQPLADAIAEARRVARRPAGNDAHVVYMSPQGRPLKQADMRAQAAALGRRSLILLAGRYEGVDERLLEAQVDEEWSIGDYVLSGGELPALVVIDAMLRLCPGVLGDDESARQDSFMDGLLDCPHYTRPARIDGRGVPEVLLGGDHKAIESWRQRQAIWRTWRRRPDLIAAMKQAGQWSDEHERLLQAMLAETEQGD